MFSQHFAVWLSSGSLSIWEQQRNSSIFSRAGSQLGLLDGDVLPDFAGESNAVRFFFGKGP
jgi:hypothetical protein